MGLQNKTNKRMPTELTAVLSACISGNVANQTNSVLFTDSGDPVTYLKWFLDGSAPNLT
jgi:hypothetical protein